MCGNCMRCLDKNICCFECVLFALKFFFLFSLMIWLFVSFHYFMKPVECNCEKCVNVTDSTTKLVNKEIEITENSILIKFDKNNN